MPALKKTLVNATFLALAMATAAPASATVLTFEDLTGFDGDVPAVYGDLTWDDGWTYWTGSGAYTPASGRQVLYTYSGNGFGSASDFVFDGAFFSGYSGASAMSFSLYQDGQLVGTSGSLGISATPTFLSSGYAGLVDRVVVNGSRGYFVMDDVTYHSGVSLASAVPEPESYAMLLGGLGALGFMARRRKQRTAGCA